MKNGRPRPTLPYPGAAIYASADKQFSRPMTGHTPRKLPRFRAISRIIADALFTRLLIIQHHPKSVKKKSEKIMSYFPQFFTVALVILSEKYQFHSSSRCFAGTLPPFCQKQQLPQFPRELFCVLIYIRYAEYYQQTDPAAPRYPAARPPHRDCWQSPAWKNVPADKRICSY